ncbi:Peroxisomal acyl-coenzyme A oxidase 3 [Armadillidium nasatum]|uniref:Acyl-coenzyme A oxidase n=1 Tax=Armadillidium nasatum TaxID=96803 RepID=A0A5N5SWJ0_9CRUS|nr:Peroxisomal acyl-coenzyme A oxidase 3 [Armadillidium nasatum]
MDLIPDLPSGPLDVYRKQASFNWKKMKLFLESPEDIEIANEAFKYMEEEPIFQHPDRDLTLEEERHLTFQRMKKVYNSDILYPDDLFMNRNKHRVLNNVISLYDWSLLARKSLLIEFPMGAFLGLGTDRHRKFINSLMNREIGFAFCLTEISHGSNTKALRTEARYDIESESFILHTPDFEAAKCWAGCLGKTASHCLVFAQLYTPDGVCHGLHNFVTPVRDPQTLQPYPGVTIFDMGAKIGLNGMDNGVIMFNHYKIPRENLLNKTGDVTVDGKYVSPFKDPSKRFEGRVGITEFGVINLTKALTISIRYSAVRRQFGPENQGEIPVLEYPLQQYRLFPYLSGLYVLHCFSVKLKDRNMSFRLAVMGGSEDPDYLANFGQEIHALSCFSKPYSGWMARDAVQESREACGGHGYLKAAGFGKIRNDNDANCTYEGDNNVLLQQTSNWLLSLWVARQRTDFTRFPMGTVSYLNQYNKYLNMKWSSDTFNRNLKDEDIIQTCLDTYCWLVCWLCKATSQDMETLKSSGKNKFDIKNNCQIFRAHNLSLAYGERVFITWFLESIKEADVSLQIPLYRLLALFSLTRVLKHVSSYVEGGLINGENVVITNIEEHITRLLSEILPDSVSLIDAFAPPDFFLNSVLGNADGRVYEHMYRKMLTSPGSVTRDTNWQEMRYNIPSKL